MPLGRLFGDLQSVIVLLTWLHKRAEFGQPNVYNARRYLYRNMISICSKCYTLLSKSYCLVPLNSAVGASEHHMIWTSNELRRFAYKFGVGVVGISDFPRRLPIDFEASRASRNLQRVYTKLQAPHTLLFLRWTAHIIPNFALKKWDAKIYDIHCICALTAVWPWRFSLAHHECMICAMI